MKYYDIFKMNKKQNIFLIVIIFSALFAYITINLMLRWLINKSYSPFIVYRIVLGLIILLFINN